MIQCEACSKKHRDEAQVEKCRARAERSAAAAAKKEAERLRREAVLRDTPVRDLIQQMKRVEGKAYEKITAELKKNYPPPFNTWGVYEVVEEYAKMLNWPMSLRRRVDALLNRHFLGEYVGGVLPRSEVDKDDSYIPGQQHSESHPDCSVCQAIDAARFKWNYKGNN